MYNILTNQKGATAILLTMLILISVLFVSLTSAEIVRMGLIMSNTQTDSTKAYFAAEAGIEEILYALRKGSFDFTDPLVCSNNQYYQFNSLSCAGTRSDKAILDANCYILYNIDGTVKKFTSFGEYAGIRRAVEISFDF